MSPYVTNKYFSNFQVDSSTRLKVITIYSKKYEKNEFFEIFNSIFSSLYLIDTRMLHYLLYYIKVPFCELFWSIFKISKHLLVDIGSKCDQDVKISIFGPSWSFRASPGSRVLIFQIIFLNSDSWYNYQTLHQISSRYHH